MVIVLQRSKENIKTITVSYKYVMKNDNRERRKIRTHGYYELSFVCLKGTVHLRTVKSEIGEYQKRELS